jgi:ribosome maturation factor RimP
MNSVDREVLNNLIERVAARESLELVHWDLVGPPGGLLLRIYIDKPGGVTHGDCQKLSKQVETLVEVEDVIASGYVLEVSSPGIERPLYKPSDYERFAGSRIKLRVSAPINGQRTFHGRLEGIKENMVHLEADSIGHLEIPYESVVRANIEFKF